MGASSKSQTKRTAHENESINWPLQQENTDNMRDSFENILDGHARIVHNKVANYVPLRQSDLVHVSVGE